MPTVCCLVPEGFMTDMLMQQYKALTAQGAHNLDLMFSPPGNFPGGFFFYVCPVGMLGEMAAVHEVPAGQLLAYGPGSHASLALDFGACDYLKDPWDLDELAARIGRRWGTDEFCFSWGTLTSDGSHTAVNGVPLIQQPAFHRLVRLMAMNAGKALSRKNLLMVMGHRNPGSRVVDVYVSWLRKEIKAIIGKGEGIVFSVYGQGYQLSR